MPEFDSPMGGAVRKNLHIFILADQSGSMENERIEALNAAMREIIPLLKKEAAEHDECDLFLSVIPFSSGAVWKDKLKVLADYERWEDLSAGGVTDLGKALELLGSMMNSKDMPTGLGKRNVPPLIVLITDGMPTDSWEDGMRKFEATGFGAEKSRTVRVALGVGGFERSVCERFTGNPELVIECSNAEQLKQMIKWATLTLSKTVSRGMSSVDGDGDEPVLVIPSPPPAIDDSVGGFTF